jgi:hypothetical protein
MGIFISFIIYLLSLQDSISLSEEGFLLLILIPYCLVALMMSTTGSGQYKFVQEATGTTYRQA